MAQGYKCIARVVKTHGIKGEVVAVPAGGLPPVLSSGLEVAVVPPSLRGSRWHLVDEVQTTDSGQLVSFADVTTTSQAHELVGKYLLAKVDNLEALEETDSLEGFIGVEVIDERLGSLGVIEEILSSSMQDTLVVQGEHGEVMIPFVDEFIVDEGLDDEPLRVAIPVGLAPWDTGKDA